MVWVNTPTGIYHLKGCDGMEIRTGVLTFTRKKVSKPDIARHEMGNKRMGDGLVFPPRMIGTSEGVG